MVDKTIYNFVDNNGGFVPIKAIDNGDGTYCLFNGTNFTDIVLTEMSLEGSEYKTVVDVLGMLNSSGIISGGVLSQEGTEIRYSTIIGFIKITNTDTDKIKFFTIPSGTLSVENNILSYIYVDYNDENPVVLSTTDRSLVNGNTKFFVGMVYRLDTVIKILQNGVLISNYQKRHYDRLISNSQLEHMSGAMLAEKSERYLTVTSGLYYAGLNRIETPAIDSSVTNFEHYYYRSSPTTWSELESTGQINNMQYNRLSDYSLQNLGLFLYGVHWIYQSYDGKLNVVMGNGSYSAGDADLSQPPAELPDYLTNFSILIGKVIIQRGASSFSSVDSQFDNVFTPIAVNNHNDLGGLQGGSLDQYYHLQSSERELLTDLNAFSLLGNSGSASGSAGAITLGSGLSFDGNSLKVVGGGSLPAGSDGDFIRYNESTESWEVVSEPLQLNGIVLKPLSEALANVEGSVYYNSTTKTVNVCVDS